MKYRPFGNTGEEISALGFGCMRLPEIERDGQWSIDEEKAIPMLRRAHELGVNYFDSAPYYCHHNSEIAVGKAVKPFRSEVKVTTKFECNDIHKTSDYREWLERSLKKMDTDYIDYYHFWGLSRGKFDEKVMPLKLLDEARKAKEEGLIRHISFSFHDDPKNIKYLIDNAEAYGVPLETMLVQYSLLDRAHEEMIAYAASKGLGVVAMGPVAGGRLSAPTELGKKLTEKPIPTYELAFKFVLGNPNICCALSGMQTMEMVEQNTRIASDDAVLTADEQRQLGEAFNSLKKFGELYCTGCNYCQPCPAGINIPRIFNAYTFHNVYELSAHAKREIDGYRHDGGKFFDSCLNCGQCERKCPQHLKIRESLQKVEAVLNTL
ncbi:MAG: aldo/keto reductase [Acutalibacteraceae bacterium]